jgi:hypothetical protein
MAERRFQTIVDRCETIKLTGTVPTYKMVHSWLEPETWNLGLTAWMHWASNNIEWLSTKPAGVQEIIFLVTHLQDAINQINHQSDILSELYSDMAEWLNENHPAVFEEWDSLSEDSSWLSS